MDFDTALVTQAIGVLGTVGTFVVAKVAIIDKMRQEIADLRVDLGDAKNLQAENKVKIDLFWSVIQSRVGSLVKAPTHDRLDELVDLFEQHIATIAELKELQDLLQLRAQERELKPIQVDAIALVQFFLADRLAAKRHAQKSGLPDPTVPRPFREDRTDVEKHADQTKKEKQQIYDSERSPKDAKSRAHEEEELKKTAAAEVTIQDSLLPVPALDTGPVTQADLAAAAAAITQAIRDAASSAPVTPLVTPSSPKTVTLVVSGTMQEETAVLKPDAKKE